MTELQILAGFISGLGLFQVGMLWLEQALRALSSNSFRRVLRITTRHRLAAITSGVFVTMLVQSSTMVGLMSMALAGAGVIPLYNAIGVMLGANLGTTFTGWVVATLGFKLDFGTYSMTLMGLGGLVMVLFNQRERINAWGQMLVGVGCLLLGLSLMKQNMMGLAEHFDLAWIREYHSFMFLLVAMVMTALMQASSATVMIALAALNSGIIDFEDAAAMVIGADVGTTFTLVLGALKGSPIKKQLAAAQFVFNVCTGLLAYLLLFPFARQLVALAGVTDPLYALVAFHSLFNAIGILLMVPIMPWYARQMEKHFRRDDEDVRQYINNVPPRMTQDAITAIAKETCRLLHQTIAINLRNLKIDPHSLTLSHQAEDDLQSLFPPNITYNDSYAAVKKLEGEILAYAGVVQAQAINTTQSQRILQLLSAVRHGVYSAKSLKDIRENLAAFRHADSASVETLYAELTQQQKAFYTRLHTLLDHADDSIFVAEEGASLLKDLEASYQRVQTGLFQRGLRDGVTETELSTSLNINRELYGALKNLVEGVLDYAAPTPHGNT